MAFQRYLRNFGMIAAESLYLGTVIASNSGVMKEMINSNSNGLLYQKIQVLSYKQYRLFLMILLKG